MMGGLYGFKGYIERENQNIEVDHCIVHRFALGSKTLPHGLKSVFDQVVKGVNFIKAKDLNSRVFKEMCKEMGEQHEALLYHTEVRWLSRGKVLNRVIELREAVQLVLEQKGSDLAIHFSNNTWVAPLCYLSDIYNELNKSNLSLQGTNKTLVDARQVVTTFVVKLKLWIRRVESGIVAQFTTLDQFLDEMEKDNECLLENVTIEIANHFSELVKRMEHYFPDRNTARLQWILYPFSVSEDAVADDDFPAKEEWITLRSNETWKVDFQRGDLQGFWISRLEEIPILARRALRILVSFATTYLCEKGFSTVLGMKTKQRTA